MNRGGLDYKEGGEGDRLSGGGIFRLEKATSKSRKGGCHPSDKGDLAALVIPGCACVVDIPIDSRRLRSERVYTVVWGVGTPKA